MDHDARSEAHDRRHIGHGDRPAVGGNLGRLSQELSTAANVRDHRVDEQGE